MNIKAFKLICVITAVEIFTCYIYILQISAHLKNYCQNFIADSDYIIFQRKKNTEDISYSVTFAKNQYHSQIIPVSWSLHSQYVKNVNTKNMCEMLTKKTPEKHHSCYLMLTLKRFHKFFWCFYCWLWTSTNCLPVNRKL